MKVGAREIGPQSSVFVIAELGSNHGGSLDRALALIDAAADAGADAAKFQYFRVDRFLVPRPDPLSLRKYELPDEWLPVLKSKCQSRGIEFLCTAFDLESLAVVDPFVDAHKIGSYEVNDGAYLDAVDATGKPWIASLGKARSIPAADILLRCISRYPAELDGYLRDAPYKWYGYLNGERWASALWGVSDHTLHPTIIPAAAVALGACVVEKHFDLFINDDIMAGFRSHLTGSQTQLPDASVSIDPNDFRELVEAVRLTEKAVRG